MTNIHKFVNKQLYTIMRYFFILVTTFILLSTTANAQERIVDASDQIPISAASILDAAGNMVGFTLSDGTFSEIPETAYPVTISCVGYEQLTIERPERKTWEMTPMVYELDEVVIAPEDRNVMRQTLYAREYFSISSQSDTVTYFLEHIVDRFIPVSDNVRFRGSSSLRTLASRCYLFYNVADKDSVAKDPKSHFPSVMSSIELSDEKITAPASFTSQADHTQVYEESGKYGVSLIQRQNGQTFTTVEDVLADKKNHTLSPWALKPLGMSTDIRQLYTTNVYMVNEDGIYEPMDLIEASYVMEADGKGRLLRMLIDSDEPVRIHAMIEFYHVDRTFMSKERAKQEYRNKPTDVTIVVPPTAPALNAATQRLIQRANAEAR